MLSREDNELLTRTGPGTAMGALIRHYWIPVVESKELDPGGRAIAAGSFLPRTTWRSAVDFRQQSML